MPKPLCASPPAHRAIRSRGAGGPFTLHIPDPLLHNHEMRPNQTKEMSPLPSRRIHHPPFTANTTIPARPGPDPANLIPTVLEPRAAPQHSTPKAESIQQCSASPTVVQNHQSVGLSGHCRALELLTKGWSTPWSPCWAMHNLL